MSSLISIKLNLSKIDKSKIIKGEKGQYLNLTVAIDDQTNEYGQNAAVWHEQSKEEREAKAERSYLGNGRVVYTDGLIQEAAERKEVNKPTTKKKQQVDDLPF